MRPRPFLLLFSLAGALTACIRAEHTVRILLLTDLTGPQSAYGQGIRLAARLALEEQQSALQEAGWRIELTAYDAHTLSGDPAAALARMAADSTIFCGIVHSGTSTNLSAARVFHTAGIPTVFPAETAPLPAAFPLPEIRWLAPDDAAHGAGDAEWAAAGGYSGVILLADAEEHAHAIDAGFIQRAEEVGLRVTVMHLPRGQDPSLWILPLLSASAQMIYFAGPAESAASIAKDLANAGIPGPFFFAESEAEDALPESYTSAEIPLYFSPAAPVGGELERAGAFADAYRTAYGDDPPPLAVLGFDAASLCIAPPLGADAADIGSSSVRQWILSRWNSGGAFEGSAAVSSFSGERPCRGQIFGLLGDPIPAWEPLPPVPADGGNSGC